MNNEFTFNTFTVVVQLTACSRSPCSHSPGCTAMGKAKLISYTCHAYYMSVCVDLCARLYMYCYGISVPNAVCIADHKLVFCVPTNLARTHTHTHTHPHAHIHTHVSKHATSHTHGIITVRHNLQLVECD